MENGLNEPQNMPRHNSGVKGVHSAMCSELRNILDRATSILPAIEAARPGCKAGIQELCTICHTVEKGNLLIQHCAEGSKLYLAITGEAVLLRCGRIRDSLSRSFFLIQNMVPLLLADQIAEVLDYLRDAKFILDPIEKEAGRALLELLQQSDASDDQELLAFQLAISKLNMSSPKSVLIERRSIKKLLDKVGSSDAKKASLLNFLLHGLKNYGKNIKQDVGEQNENMNAENRNATQTMTSPSNSGDLGTSLEQTDRYDNLSSAALPPENFFCPISRKVMNDPVIIASGQTYERECIERWFKEGHDTCPRTDRQLENFSVIPNASMKDMISDWSREHSIEGPKPILPSKDRYFSLSEVSESHSISSLHNVSAPLIRGKAGDYVFQCDHSNISFASDTSYVSDSSHVRSIDETKSNSYQLFSWSVDYQNYQSFFNFNHDMFLRLFFELSELPTEIQVKAMEDLRILLKGDDDVRHAMISNGFAEAFTSFLKDLVNRSNLQSQKAAVQFFISFLTNSRIEIPTFNEEALHLISSFLDSELKMEALLILHELVHHQNCRRSDIMVYVVAPSVLELMQTEDMECLELVMKIMCELSSDGETKHHLISLGLASKLAPILTGDRLTDCCLKIFRNLSEVEEATTLIAKTDGCLASIAEYLDIGSREEQEDAVVTLLAICSQSLENCSLVLKEGVIPALVDLSVNGSAEGKESSMKLLHLLRDSRRSDTFNNSCSQEAPISEIVEDPPNHPVVKEQISKSNGFFSRKMKFFSKPRSLALF